MSTTTPGPVHLPAPPDAISELVSDIDLDDERLWVPRGDDIWSLPLMFSVTTGMWVNITRARGRAVISRHRHSSPVTGYTLDGTWGYVEHDWIAKPGTFIYEPAGETHTLYCKGDAGHMLVLFHNFGPILFVDEHGNQTGFEDVFTRLEKYKTHCNKVGLGEDFVQNLVR